jgi:stage III sporulation protein SpoIIIAA
MSFNIRVQRVSICKIETSMIKKMITTSWAHFALIRRRQPHRAHEA